ncbi:hypothetical protein JCM8097_003658 [Rhodosporidiobolus ruineniae]
MNFLSSLGSAVLNASSAALHSAQGGIPGLQGYTLGERVNHYDGKTIWTLYSGLKKDDQTPVTVFSFDLSAPSHSSSADRRSLLPLARNALRKLRALRHPNILKFLDGSESDSAVWIVTEPVRCLALELEGGGGVNAMSEEAKLYGLLHVCTALNFLNRDGQSVHGGLRNTSVWVTPGGEWKLGGMEVCSRLDEADGTMWNYGGLLPDSRTHASPEVRRGGWTALKEYDASTLDSYLLHLFLYTVFNGPLPSSFLSPSSPSDTPSLPQQRGSIPTALFTPWRRLGNPNPAARLKTSAFLELGTHPAEGWWPSNRLVKLSAALEGFALASENERAGLIRTLKAIAAGAANAKTEALPAGFLKYKVLPSLVHSFEFGGGTGAAQLLPVILGLAGNGDGMEEKEYERSVVQPIVRMYATPDRAVRMALLENLDKYVEKVSTKDVCERVWPHLLTGFGDVVPVIREATVKSILIIAPKLNDRILNNDLLRHLGKTQTDVEPGIRTNTCILLSRLSRHLSTSTQRKVLIPAFARAIRDPFVHARIAGLMALMATVEVFEKEDIAGKVIPAMSICLVDREKTVRDQAFKAIDMFVKKCEQLTASMPETALPPPDPSASPASAAAQQPGGLAAQAASQTQPGIATSATGAAGALAGWAFASVSKKLSTAELAAPIERRSSTPVVSGAATPVVNGSSSTGVPRSSTDSFVTTPSLPGGFDGGVARGTEDWGGDLIDVENDDADWNEFESGQAPPSQRAIDPLAARLSASKPKVPRAKVGGALKLKSSALKVPMDMDASDSWDLDDSDKTPVASPAASTPIPRAPLSSAPAARPTPITIGAGAGGIGLVKKPTPASASLLAAAAASGPPAPAPAPPALPSLVLPTDPISTSSVPPSSLPPSPLPPSAEPPTAPVPPQLPTVPSAPPVSPGVPPAIIPLPISPASSAPSTPTLGASGGAGGGGSMAGLSKEEKAAAMAKAREERRRRMAEAKAKR